MSRVGNKPITIPGNVDVLIDGSKISVSGPKGNLEFLLRPELQINKTENQLLLKTRKQDRLSKSLHGLARSLLNNMVYGVIEGWVKNLEMVGVGYRAQAISGKLVLNVGFSHPVEIQAPKGIILTVSDNTKISVSGIDKELVGQVAANIRAIKPPEVYKGKGIRYAGEYVRRKPGKAGKTVGGAK